MIFILFLSFCKLDASLKTLIIKQTVIFYFLILLLPSVKFFHIIFKFIFFYYWNFVIFCFLVNNQIKAKKHNFFYFITFFLFNIHKCIKSTYSRSVLADNLEQQNKTSTKPLLKFVLFYFILWEQIKLLIAVISNL